MVWFFFAWWISNLKIKRSVHQLQGAYPIHRGEIIGIEAAGEFKIDRDMLHVMGWW